MIRAIAKNNSLYQNLKLHLKQPWMKITAGLNQLKLFLGTRWQNPIWHDSITRKGDQQKMHDKSSRQSLSNINYLYGTRENRHYLKKGIHYAGKPLGRPKKETLANKAELKAAKKQRQADYVQRIPIKQVLFCKLENLQKRTCLILYIQITSNLSNRFISFDCHFYGLVF